MRYSVKRLVSSGILLALCLLLTGCMAPPVDHVAAAKQQMADGDLQGAYESLDSARSKEASALELLNQLIDQAYEKENYTVGRDSLLLYGNITGDYSLLKSKIISLIPGDYSVESVYIALKKDDTYSGHSEDWIFHDPKPTMSFHKDGSMMTDLNSDVYMEGQDSDIAGIITVDFTDMTGWSASEENEEDTHVTLVLTRPQGYGRSVNLSFGHGNDLYINGEFRNMLEGKFVLGNMVGTGSGSIDYRIIIHLVPLT